MDDEQQKPIEALEVIEVIELTDEDLKQVAGGPRIVNDAAVLANYL